MSPQSLYMHAALTQPLTHSSCDSVFLLHVIDLSASAGSKMVVITANAWSDEQTYLSVVQTNVDMYRGIIPRLAQLSPNGVLLVASQPGSQTQTHHLLALLLLKYNRDSKLALFISFINSTIRFVDTYVTS